MTEGSITGFFFKLDSNVNKVKYPFFFNLCKLNWEIAPLQILCMSYGSNDPVLMIKGKLLQDCTTDPFCPKFALQGSL